jgi:membrane associated rhomboid family serine protease
MSVTASAPLFGVIGSYLALIAIYWSKIGLLAQRQLLLYLCPVPLFFIALSFLPNVDFVSNLGGLIGGFAVGSVLFATKAEDPKWKVLYAFLGGIGLGICITAPIMWIQFHYDSMCSFP